MYEFKGQQAEAIKTARAWLAVKKRRPQIFRLFGFAGAGKTTLAKEIASHAKGNVVYATLSGKAALVMQTKGCWPSGTIHSTIYKAIEDKETGKFHYILNPDSPLTTASLLVLDEVSMVNEEIAADILSFGVPVLALGDPFQLPPPEGQGYFINARPDFMLTEIHRQAAGNPIIRMSIDIREGRGLALGNYGESQVIRRADISREALREIVLGADQVICGRNATRHTFNSRIRTLKGIDSITPVTGDRVICLRNNREKNLLNGGMWSVDKTTDAGGVSRMQVSSLDMPGVEPADVDVLHEFWTGREKSVDFRMLRNFDQFSYGYAITCHKAQGSQFDNLALFDESGAFREDADKWLYTGITRAAERVTVVV